MLIKPSRKTEEPCSWRHMGIRINVSKVKFSGHWDDNEVTFTPTSVKREKKARFVTFFFFIFKVQGSFNMLAHKLNLWRMEKIYPQCTFILLKEFFLHTPHVHIYCMHILILIKDSKPKSILCHCWLIILYKKCKPSSNIQVYAKLCGLKCRTQVVQNQDGGTNPDLLP